MTSGQTDHALPTAGSAKEMVWIPGGSFLMGSDHHYPEEAPAHRVTVEGFWIDHHTVTNAEFARFVARTGHVTMAERAPDPADYPGARPELLVPASTVFRQPPHRVDLGNHYNWWTYVPGADYIRITVVLFLVGIGSTFKLHTIRYALIAVGSLLLILATVLILQQPGLPS